MSANARPHICFVAHNALGALLGDARSHAGGIERQQALMCQWLAAQGRQVSIVTWREDRDVGETINGVRHIPLCAKSDGLPVLRFVHPRWTSLNRALKQADADIYYYNCGDLGLGQIAHWTRSHGKHLVYSVASDADCETQLANLSGARERVLYRYGLKHCDSIIVQTRKQADLLARNFGRETTVLAMPSEGYADVEPARSPDRPVVVWIGRISREKRPEWLLDIAEQLPQYDFEIIGAANEVSGYASAIAARAERIANVRMVGRVPYDEMSAYYRRASLLCSTSVYEGFPNIFLEAWSIGVPTVATVDPDGLIAGRGLGRVGSSVAELTRGIGELLGSAGELDKAGLRARQYFSEVHSLDKAMSRFAQFFDHCTQTG